MRPTTKLVSLVRQYLTARLDANWMAARLMKRLDQAIADPSGVIAKRFDDLIEGAVDDLMADDFFVASVIDRNHRQLNELERRIAAAFTKTSGVCKDCGFRH